MTFSTLSYLCQNILDNIKTKRPTDDAVENISDAKEFLRQLEELKATVSNDVETLAAAINEHEREAKVSEKVESCGKFFEGVYDDELKTLKKTIVSELSDVLRVASLKTYPEGGYKNAKVGVAALFVALHQETTIELDYELAKTSDKTFVVDRFGIDDYRLEYKCDYGSEGIYLDLYLCEHNDEPKYHVATIKTLRDDDEAFRAMNALGCEYRLAFHHFPQF